MRRGTRVRPTLKTMDLVQDVHSPLYRLLDSLVSSSFLCRNQWRNEEKEGDQGKGCH